jgi:putative transposase
MAQESIDRLGELLQGLFMEEQGPRQLLEWLSNRAMDAEVTGHLRALPHERTDHRQGYRNGTKSRTLHTRVGALGLSVPQVRGCEPYHPSLFAKWQRSERALLVACAEMYYQGVSTRNVRDVLEAMCDGEISAMTVSRIAQELDEKLNEFRSRRLDGTAYPYLIVDARYERVRVSGRVVSQAVIVVSGISAQGVREVLDWRVDDCESEQTWGEVFRGLKDRGLRGVELVVSDAHGGIRAAMTRHFQGVAWQRCRVHFLREIGRKVPHKHKRDLLADVRAVLAGEDRGECVRRGREAGAKWGPRYPAVATMLEQGLEDCLTVLGFPAEHRRKLAGTNLMERVMRTIKKRTAVVGVFCTRAACDRLVGAMLLEVHEDWSLDRDRYLNMDLRPVTG